MGRGLKLATDVFDYQDAVSRLGDVDMLRVEAWEFLQLRDEYVRQIREAARSGDTPSLARTARTLQLALRDLSGARAVGSAAALENAAKARAVGHAMTLADELEQELAELSVALACVVSPPLMN